MTCIDSPLDYNGYVVSLIYQDHIVFWRQNFQKTTVMNVSFQYIVHQFQRIIIIFHLKLQQIHAMKWTNNWHHFLTDFAINWNLGSSIITIFLPWIDLKLMSTGSIKYLRAAENALQYQLCSRQRCLFFMYAVIVFLCLMSHWVGNANEDHLVDEMAQQLFRFPREGWIDDGRKK